MQETTVTGVVERKRINIGSKSERDALIVRMPDGSDASLRVIGINPFAGRELEQFAGMRVKINGLYDRGVLFVRHTDDISILGPQPRPRGPNPAP